MYTHSNLEWIWMKTRKKWSNHSWELFMMWMFQYKSKICKVWAHKNVDKFFLLRDFCAMRLFLRIHYNLIWPVWKPIMYLNTNKKIKHFRAKKTWQGFWWTWPPPDIMYFGFLLHEVWLWWPLQWVCDATLLSKWRKVFAFVPPPRPFWALCTF